MKAATARRCVICHSQSNLTAHHIVRKSFLPEARFQTGNGITLCNVCHKEPHKAFNKRPDIDLPMDAQGGENIELLMGFFSALMSDAKRRSLLNDQYYYLSDEVLIKFKAFQSISRDLPFPGTRLEQAYLIWRQTPRRTLGAFLQAMGFSLSDDFIQLGTFSVIPKP